MREQCNIQTVLKYVSKPNTLIFKLMLSLDHVSIQMAFESSEYSLMFGVL